MRARIIASITSIAALLFGLALVGGNATAGPTATDTRSQSGSASTGDVNAAAVFNCLGGAQKRVATRINNSPFVFGENPAFVQVPGGVVTVPGPATGADVVNVDFSSEVQLRGAGADLFDWIELEVRRNGVALQPVGGPGDPLAFSGTPTYLSAAAQFCGGIRRGNHTYTVWVKIVDNGANGALSGWLDDMTLEVEVSQ